MAPPLAINALEHEIGDAIAFCVEENLGIEVTGFAFSSGLDIGYEERIARNVKALEGIAWVSLHGPFIDLIANSPDPAIVEVSKQRHGLGLDAAKRVGAKIYVAHLNANPLIRNKGYRNNFPKAVANFWLPFADDAGKHGMTIVLENLWEEGPEWQKRVIEEANHPHLKASLDNGHALVFSERPAKEWIEVLGPDLYHCHLHDNDGTYDQHKSIGEGIEDWPSSMAITIRRCTKRICRAGKRLYTSKQGKLINN